MTLLESLLGGVPSLSVPSDPFGRPDGCAAFGGGKTCSTAERAAPPGGVGSDRGTTNPEGLSPVCLTPKGSDLGAVNPEEAASSLNTGGRRESVHGGTPPKRRAGGTLILAGGVVPLCENQKPVGGCVQKRENSPEFSCFETYKAAWGGGETGGMGGGRAKSLQRPTSDHPFSPPQMPQGQSRNPAR